MTSAGHCSQCGGRLVAGVLGNRCPRCLLGLGVGPADEAGQPAFAKGGGCLGDYELFEELGRGGMGVVYRARQISLNRIVALKTLAVGPCMAPELETRLQAEAEAVAGLNHPNIVAVYESGQGAGAFCFSMEYVEGHSLAHLTRHHSLAPTQAARYVREVAEAVHHAHQHGILHRDLKPSNILIDRQDRVKVTDFGLARRLGADPGLTVTGQVIGSPGYLSPEQAAGKPQALTVRSDVYSLGAVLYHLLTARPPLVGESLEETLVQIREKQVPSPRLLSPGVPRDLETICLRCLEKEPGRRYETAQALADDLGRFLDHEPVHARPVSCLGRVWRWCRRQPALAGALAGGVLVLLLGVLGITWQWARAEAEAQAAQRSLYGADMLLAQQALERSDLGHVRGLLNRYRPAAAPGTRSPGSARDLRGWEWRFLWSRCQGDEAAPLLTGTNPVKALAFAADGRQIAIRYPGTVVLWDLQARQVLWEHPAFPGFDAFAVAPGGRLLAWGTREADGTPRVVFRDLPGQREVARLPLDSDPVSLAFSADVRWLAALTRRTEVLVWSLDSWQVVARCSARTPIPLRQGTDFGRVQFAPGDRLLAVGTHRVPVQLVDWAGGTARDIATFKDGEGATALAFSPDGRWLAMGLGYFDTAIYLQEVATGGTGRLEGHLGWIAGLAFAPDGRMLVSASSDQTMRLWDVERGVEVGRLQGHEHELTAVAWTADGRHLVSGSVDGSIRLWDPSGQVNKSLYQVLPDRTRDLDFAAGRERLVTLRWDAAAPAGSRGAQVPGPTERCLVLRDPGTLEETGRITSHGPAWMRVALAGDGRRLAVGDSQGSVDIWDLDLRQLVTNLVVGSGWIRQLQFSRAGDRLLCCDEDAEGRGVVQIRDTSSWKELGLPGAALQGLKRAVLAPDGRILAVAYGDVTVGWWDLRTGQRRAHFWWSEELGGGIEMAYSPDGRWFAAGGVSRGVVLMEVATRRLRFRRAAHLGPAASLAFSPDSQRLITSSPAGVDSLKVWDVESGREVATLAGLPGFFDRIGFTPDGGTVFAVNHWTGRILLWRAPSWADVAARDLGGSRLPGSGFLQPIPENPLGGK